MRFRDLDEPALCESDDALLGSARPVIADWDASALERQLEDVRTQHGTEFATAWLYQAICQHPRHREFIEYFDQVSVLPVPRLVERPTICVVPGAFYREHPRTGAGGHVLRAELHALGLPSDVIPVNSTGTLAENASIILNYLRARSAGPLILISLSKGSADTKVALQLSPQHFKDTVMWVSISGTLIGAPLVQWVEQRRWARALNWLWFQWTGRDRRFFSDMAYGQNSRLDFALECPNNMTLVHVAGFPLQHHTRTRLARVWYRRFQQHGPTDSAIMLRELLQVPGYVLPVWGVDHYWKSQAATQRVARGIARHVVDIVQTGGHRDAPAMQSTATNQTWLAQLETEQWK